MLDVVAIILGLGIVLFFMWCYFVEIIIKLNQLNDKIDKFNAYIGNFEDELEQIRQFHKED